MELDLDLPQRATRAKIGKSASMRIMQHSPTPCFAILAMPPKRVISVESKISKGKTAENKVRDIMLANCGEDSQSLSACLVCRLASYPGSAPLRG